MALDLTVLGATSVQAAVKIANYTLNTNIDPNWVTATGVGSPFLPYVLVTMQSVTQVDGNGNPPIYIGGGTFFYNRVGFQRAFQGLNLKLRMQPPFTVAQVVAQVKAQYGIVIEQIDISNLFNQNILMDGQGFVTLNPSGGGLRFYIDYSPFVLKIAIDTSVLTDLQRLLAMTQMADMAALNAHNTPSTPAVPALPPLPDRSP